MRASAAAVSAGETPESVATMSRRSAMSARRSLWCVALIGLVAPLLPISALGAAEGDSVGADGSAADAEAQNDTMPDDSAGGVEVVRYAGSDQYETSIEVARALVDLEGGSSEQVVLASGESWADAAMAGPLAASLGAPVVLVPPGGLQTAAARPDLVEFLRSTGVRRVVIVGSADVLPNHEPSVLYGLGMLPRNIERVDGDDSVRASVAVAERIGAPAEFGELGRTVVIASGQSVADAVTVGPLAAAGPFPLLLTPPNQLDPRIAAYLAEQQIEHVVLVGGTAAIAPAVREAIEAAAATVTRLEGEDRYHTAALAMDLLTEAPGCTSNAIDSIGLALGDEPQLALTAGRLLGPQCIPLLFTEAGRLALVTQNHLYLYRHRTGIEPSWHLIGDDVTIDPSAIELPPVRMATVADNPDGNGQHIVVLDEHHQARHYLTDAGFDGITDVRWTSDRATITFTGIRDSSPLIYEGIRGGTWAFRETVQGGMRQKYELDLRSDTAQPRSRFPTWYAHLIQSIWVDPISSPDRQYVVFRAPTEDYAGHSLFAIHVETETVAQITHNATNDTHHVVSSDWLPDGRRLIYTHVEIAQLKNPVPVEHPSHPNRAYAYAEPTQFGSECGNVPQRRAHIVDVATGHASPLPHGSYLIDQPILLSPDGRFVAIKSYEDYEFAPERDIMQFFYWGCTHDGIGMPSISVHDISGAEPRTETEPGLSGYGPMWSPDGSYLVYRAPAGTQSGHSLFAVDIETGIVTQVTHNQSNEHHHVAQRWLSNDSRLLYTVQSIEILEEPCHHLSPAQQRPFGIPHVAAHILDLEHMGSAQLGYEGFVSAGWWDDSGFGAAADGRHISFVANSSYEYVSSQASCGYRGWEDSQFYLYDISTPTPLFVDLHLPNAADMSWSPDGRYLSLAHADLSRHGPLKRGYSVLDTEDGSIWTMPLSGIFDTQARLIDVEWTPDGNRLLYDVELGDYRNRTYATIIADVEANQIVRLTMPDDFGGRLRFRGYSPDGRAVIHRDNSRSGKLWVHDLADGAILGTYHIYAVTEPGEPVLDDPGGRGNILESFRFAAEWSSSGIFTSGEHYLYEHTDF